MNRAFAVWARPWVVVVGVACGGDNPCVEGCEEDHAFWEACYETLQQDYGLSADCYIDIDALVEQLAEAGDDPEARAAVYAAQHDAGNAVECDDADAITDDCVDRSEAEWRLLDADAREAREEECLQPDDTEVTRAMEEEDCDAFVTALGLGR